MKKLRTKLCAMILCLSMMLGMLPVVGYTGAGLLEQENSVPEEPSVPEVPKEPAVPEESEGAEEPAQPEPSEPDITAPENMEESFSQALAQVEQGTPSVDAETKEIWGNCTYLIVQGAPEDPLAATVYVDSNANGVVDDDEFSLNGNSLGGEHSAEKIIENAPADGSDLSEYTFGGATAGTSLKADHAGIAIYGATVGAVYGGEKAADSMPIDRSSVTIVGSTVLGNVYGGGMPGAIGKLSTYVTITDSTINGSVYGGGLKSNVAVNTNVKVINSSVANVYGAGGGTADDPGASEVGKYSNIYVDNVKLAAGGVVSAGGSGSTHTAKVMRQGIYGWVTDESDKYIPPMPENFSDLLYKTDEKTWIIRANDGVLVTDLSIAEDEILYVAANQTLLTETNDAENEIINRGTINVDGSVHINSDFINEGIVNIKQGGKVYSLRKTHNRASGIILNSGMLDLRGLAGVDKSYLMNSGKILVGQTGKITNTNTNANTNVNRIVNDEETSAIVSLGTITNEVVFSGKPILTVPTVDKANSVIYANGMPLLVAKEGTGATVYFDVAADGVLGENDITLSALNMPLHGFSMNIDAPEAGADLSSYAIYGGGETVSAEETYIAVLGATVDAIYGGGKVNTNGNTHVTVAAGAHVRLVYGGGDSTVNSVTSESTTTQVNIIDSTIEGTDAAVYGGGIGQVGGGTIVSVTGSTVPAVYGGGKGTVLGGTSVAITADSKVDFVYGGGVDAVQGGTSVKIAQSTVGSVYGGGEADVLDGTSVAITDSKVDFVYGGGVDTVQGGTSVKIAQSTVGSVYGGGKADVHVGTSVEIAESKVDLVYGGGEAAVQGAVVTTITDSTVGKAYAGGRANVVGDATINVVGGKIADGVAGGGVYGGGDGAEVSGSKNGTVAMDGAVVESFDNLLWQESANWNVKGAHTITIPITVEKGVRLHIPLGATLAARAAVINNGVIHIDGKYENWSTLTNTASGTIMVYGEFANETPGKTLNNGKIYMYGAQTGTGVIEGVPAITKMVVVDHAAKAIYANGVPIILREGDAAGQTKISTDIALGFDRDLDLDTATEGVQNSADLSEYNIFGGASSQFIGNTSVVMEGGIVKNIFGGGAGENGSLEGNTSVVLKNGTIVENIYGANEGKPSALSATLTGNTSVKIEGGQVGSITGGNIGNVYGGGKYCAVTGQTSVAMTGGKIGQEGAGGASEAGRGTIYGGSVANSVGSTDITVSGGSIVRGVFGAGGMLAGDTKDRADVVGNVNISITGKMEETGKELYVAGVNFMRAKADKHNGHMAEVGGDVTINLKNATWNDALIYGASDFKWKPVSGNVTINLDNSSVKSVYGAGNESAVKKNVYINIKNKSHVSYMISGGADGYRYEDTVLGSVYINHEDSHLPEFLYGGSYDGGAVLGDTNVTVLRAYKGTAECMIHGGGYGANVGGNTNVTLTDVALGTGKASGIAIMGGGRAKSGPIGRAAMVGGNSKVTIDGESEMWVGLRATGCGIVGGASSQETNADGNLKSGVAGNSEVAILSTKTIKGSIGAKNANGGGIGGIAQLFIINQDIEKEINVMSYDALMSRDKDKNWEVKGTGDGDKPFVLDRDITIEEGKILENVGKLHVPKGATITNNGEIHNYSKFAIADQTIVGTGRIMEIVDYIHTRYSKTLDFLPTDIPQIPDQSFNIERASSNFVGCKPELKAQRIVQGQAFYPDADGDTVTYTNNIMPGVATATYWREAESTNYVRTFNIKKADVKISAPHLELTYGEKNYRDFLATLMKADTATRESTKGQTVDTSRSDAGSYGTIEIKAIIDGTTYSVLGASKILEGYNLDLLSARFDQEILPHKVPFKLGENKFLFKYSGCDFINPCETEIPFTLLAKDLKSASVAPGYSKVYDGTTDFKDAPLQEYTDIVPNDIISGTASGSVSGADVGEYELVIDSVALGGEKGSLYKIDKSKISNANKVAITPARPEVIVTSDSKTNTGVAGQKIKLIATVPAENAKGTVQFEVSGDISGQIPLVDGVATFDWTPGQAYSNQTVTARYWPADGVKNYIQSTGGAIFNITVNEQPPLSFEDGDAVTIVYDNDYEMSTVGGNLDIRTQYTITSGNDVVQRYTGTNKLKAVKTGTATIKATKAGNSILKPATATLTITVAPAEIKITGYTAKDKEYDGTTAATITEVQFNKGLITGAPLVLGRDYFVSEVAFESKNVGERAVTGNVTLASDSNFVLADGNLSGGKADITAAPITISGGIVENKEWDGSKLAPVSSILFSGIKGDDSLEMGKDYTVADAEYADAEPGKEKPVVAGKVVLNATEVAANYALADSSLKDKKLVGDIAIESVKVKITAQNKEYDGTRDATVVYTVEGLPEGVVLSAQGTASFDDASAGEGKTVTASGITLVGDNASSYRCNTTATTTANITRATQASLAITPIGNKTYGNGQFVLETTGGSGTGAVSFSVPAANGVLSINGNTATIVGAGTVIVTAIKSGGGNYDEISATQSITIAPKSVRVSINASDKTYDGTAAATANYSVDGMVASDEVTARGSAAFGNAAVGENKTVTASGIALEGAKAASYELSNTTATTTANITQKKLTWNKDGTVVRRQYNATANATIENKPTLNGVVEKDIVTAKIGTVEFANTSKGEHSIIASGFGIEGEKAANYAKPDTQPIFAKGIIDAKQITPQINITSTHTFNTAQQIPVTTVADGATVLAPDVDYTATYGENINAGASAGSVSVELKGNYSGTKTERFEIKKGTTTNKVVPNPILMTAGAEKEQSTPLPAKLENVGAMTFEVKSVSDSSIFQKQPTISADNTKLEFSNNTNATNGQKSEVVITISSENYNDFTFTITIEVTGKISLDLSGLAAGENLVYNGNPQAGYTGTLVAKNGTEIVTDIGTPAFSYVGIAGTTYVSATPPTNAGSYNLVVSVAADNAQYAGSHAVIPFTIAKAGITVAKGDYAITKEWDGSTNAGTASGKLAVTGIVNNDDVKVSAVPRAYPSTDAGTHDVVVNLAIAGADVRNYSLESATITIAATITKSDAIPVAAPAPNAVPIAKSDTTIKLDQVAVDGEIVEYAKSTSNTAPSTGWQEGKEFVGLDAATDYYFFARVKANNNHPAGASSAGTKITTEKATHALLAPKKITIVAEQVRNGEITLEDIFGAGKVPVGAKFGAITGPSTKAVMNTVELSGGKIVYQSKNNAKDSSEKDIFTTTITCDKYYDITLAIHFEAANKADADIKVTISDKEYDGLAMQQPTASSEQNLTYTYQWMQGSKILASAPTNAGNYKLRVTGSNDEYQGIVERQFEIKKAKITVTKGSYKFSKIYDGTTDVGAPSGTLAIAGIVATDTEVKVTATPSKYDSENAGSRIVDVGLELSGKAHENYELTPRVLTIPATIEKAEQRAFSINEATSKTYGDASFTLATTGGSGTGVVRYSTSASGVLSISGNTAAIKGAGEVTITATKEASTNHNSATATTTVDIAKKTIAVNISAENKVYDAETSAKVSYSIDGKIGGDAVAATGTASFADAKAGEKKTVTAKGINLSGVDLKNYTLSNTTATTTANIAQKPLIIKAESYEIVIGADAPEYTHTTSGLVGAQTIGGVKFTCAYAKGDATTGIAGKYKITPEGGTVSAGNENYKISYEEGTLTVTINTSAIDKAIAEANTAKTGILTSDKNENEVESGKKFVTSAAMGELNTAIVAAEAAKTGATTTEQLELAKDALIAATNAFKAAIKTGTAASGGSEDRESPSDTPDPIGPQKPTGENLTDIAGHWAEESIKFVVGKGLFQGTSDTMFEPDINMNRAMFVTVLGRMGAADVSGKATPDFADIADDSYYAGYVAWASEMGIVQGTGEKEFSPQRAISRQELMVMLVSYAKATGASLPKIQKEQMFADSENIAPWAKDAAAVLQQAGILTGREGNKCEPEATATRAEVATLLERFIMLMAK